MKERLRISLKYIRIYRRKKQKISCLDPKIPEEKLAVELPLWIELDDLTRIAIELNYENKKRKIITFKIVIKQNLEKKKLFMS